MRRRHGGPVLGAIVLGVLAGAAPAAAASPEPSGSPAPAQAVWVTGTIGLAPDCDDPTVTVENGVTIQRTYRCAPQTWTMSDPRLSGSAVTVWNADSYMTTNGLVSVTAGRSEVTNDVGSWTCTYADGLGGGMGLFTEPINEDTVTCTGAGGYAGLTAILVNGTTSTGTFQLQGILLPGPLPPTP